MSIPINLFHPSKPRAAGRTITWYRRAGGGPDVEDSVERR
jgi:hypothetical protein